jgi:hypothetical protein
VVGVGKERERQAEVALELLVGGDPVGGDAEHDRARLLELAPRIPDPAGLRRAAGRVVLGIEVEDDRLALEGRERHGVAGVALQLEIGGRLALFNHGSSSR